MNSQVSSSRELYTVHTSDLFIKNLLEIPVPQLFRKMKIPSEIWPPLAIAFI